MMTRGTTRDVTSIPTVRIAAFAFAVVFLLVGILGFVPGITTNFGEMSFAGHHSGAMLLGVFQVSVLHNLVHLAFGVVGLILARTVAGARGFLIGGGIVYAILWIYGLLINKATAANFIPVNSADDWLHFVLAAAMIITGVVLGRTIGRTAPRDLR
jgi:hypothetical protein